MEDKDKLGVTDLYMLMVVLFWALNFSFIKIALQDFTPLAFNGIRMILASAALVFILAATKKGLGVEKKSVWKLVVLGIIGNTGYQWLFIHGINLTTASNTSIIMAMTPVFVALLSSLLKHEKIHWAAWVGIALSFAGFYLVITEQPGTFVFSWHNLKGDMMIFMGNLCWAVFTVFSKPFLEKTSPLKWSSLTLAAGTLFFLPLCAKDLLQLDYSQISSGSWAILGYSGLIALATCYFLWYTSVKRVGNSKTAIYGNITPIFTVVFAYVIISERIGFWQILGALIILIGVYLTRSGYRLFRRRKKRG